MNPLLPYGFKVKVGPENNIPPHITDGKVVDVFTTEIGRIYAVDFGKIISEEYPYTTIGIPEVFFEGFFDVVH